MYNTEIKNPKTNRNNKAYAWKIDPRKVLGAFKNGEFQDCKDLSLALLSDEKSIQVMEEQQFGESLSSNFALNVFECGLDWSLGIKVLGYIKTFTSDGKIPKPFEVIATKSGHVFIRSFSGNIY